MLEILAVVSVLAQAPAPPPATEGAIEGEWRIEILDNIRIMPDAAVTIAFRGGRVSGFASCNTFQGEFTARNGALTTSNLLTTMKACDGARMSQERDFLALLRAATKYERRNDDTLLLTTPSGKSIRASRK
jgi:heat shock protein HslJ